MYAQARQPNAVLYALIAHPHRTHLASFSAARRRRARTDGRAQRVATVDEVAENTLSRLPLLGATEIE
jgi:hypothetical protein